MGPKDHGIEQRAPVEFLRRMLAIIEAGTVELPAFPQVVIRVQEVLKNPNYSLQMIVRPISADPTLANRLLNMANSTAFNATGRVIIDLSVALTRLGAQKVYSVVLAHAKNWHVNDAVCEAVGMQTDVLAVRSGPPTLTDVLVAGMRLANRMMNSGDTSSLSSGGVLARLNLSIEECRGLIGEAEAEVRALARALHS